MIDTPELEVLAAAAAGDRERQRGRLPILLEACDPARLVEEARRHAMAPALWAALDGLPVEEPLRSMLSDVAAADRAVSLRLAEGLAAVVRSGDARGLRIVALKGPALGVLAHGDPAARASRDLDLWSPDPAARALLTDVAVDWEDRLVVGAPRTVRVEVMGVSVETPGPEDAALVLCAAPAWKLGRVADLVALLRLCDRAALRARARETRLTRALDRGLSLAEEPRRWSAPGRLQRLFGRLRAT